MRRGLTSFLIFVNFSLLAQCNNESATLDDMCISPVHRATSVSPVSPQVVLLSATMPADVLEVTKKFMREPIRILVKKEELTLEGIKQFYINVEREVGCVHQRHGSTFIQLQILSSCSPTKCV